jgi:signal transduction histidine kinase
VRVIGSVIKIFLYWLKARRAVLAYAAGAFGLFFLVYALYGYPWGVAGYAALLSLTLGAAFAVWDFAVFAVRHYRLTQLTARFPVENLPEPRSLIEQDYNALIASLEAERIKLTRDNEHHRRDAEEYYTLWAHQIKTPIAAMNLLLQSRQSCIASDARDELAHQLFRIEKYVEMVLQYQRLSSLTNDLAPEEYELSALVNKAAKSCAALFIHKGLPLNAESVRGSIVTDAKWFCFVLEQILSNAVKYTDCGTVKVYSTERDGKNTSSVLCVEDTGIGIPASDLPRVFERGFTGGAGRTERSSTGIGLYLCKRILNRLGFGIEIESDVGKGTRVRLLLTQERPELD